MHSRTIIVRPAAGPETLMGEPLRYPITIPPTIPAIKPEIGGAPEAMARPRHKGSATRKTDSEALRSLNMATLC